MAQSTHTHSRRLRSIVECANATLRAVDEVVEDDDVAWLDFRLQAPSGSGGNDVRALQHLQRVDVGAIVHIRRVDRMAPAVTG